MYGSTSYLYLYIQRGQPQLTARPAAGSQPPWATCMHGFAFGSRNYYVRLRSSTPKTKLTYGLNSQAAVAIHATAPSTHFDHKQDRQRRFFNGLEGHSLYS